jgi:hypothetical protein
MKLLNLRRVTVNPATLITNLQKSESFYAKILEINEVQKIL